MRVYQKRGNLNYKERRMVEQLTKVLEEKTKADPNFSFSPAENSKELEQMWTEFCTDEVEFSEIKNSDVEPVNVSDEPIENEPNNDTQKETGTNDFEDEDDDWDDTGSNSDPFNRDEPIVRDYVKGSDFPDDIKKVDTKSTYAEPRTQRDQMRMPGMEDDAQTNNSSKVDPVRIENNNSGSGNQKSSNSGGGSAPMNPKFNEMSDAQKKKQTTRMAKSIVRLVCTLAEKGFEFWGTKGITEDEINNLESNQVIDTDLEVMSMLEPGTLVTIKQFFAQQRMAVAEISKITEDEKQMLTESLVEVMIEKGIGPTPMQNLLLNIAEVILVRGLAIYGIQKQNSNIIQQLTEMKEMQKKQYAEYNDRENQYREYTQQSSETNLTKVEPVTTNND
jgi:hypothetical protein